MDGWYSDGMATKKTTAKKTAAKTNTKVDIYPNRMTFAVSALAGVTLIFIGLVAVQ